MKSFAELPDNTRMAALSDLDTIGAENAGYSRSGIIIAVPVGKSRECDDWAAKYGMKLASECYFPLGSDKPRQSLRHDGPEKYGKGNKGFWLYAKYEVQG